jgi:basic membrane protein A
MLRRQFSRLVGAGVVASALPTLILPAQGADPLKVGFLYLGPVGDFGWTYQHDVARKAAIEHFGDKIKTTLRGERGRGPRF